jgi:hypothetical protein
VCAENYLDSVQLLNCFLVDCCVLLTQSSDIVDSWQCVVAWHAYMSGQKLNHSFFHSIAAANVCAENYLDSVQLLNCFLVDCCVLLMQSSDIVDSWQCVVAWHAYMSGKN